MTHDFVRAEVIGYLIMDLCGIISGCFLGDALRRFYNSFKNERGLLKNEKVMLLHLLAFLLYTVMTICRTAITTSWLGSSDNKNYQKSLITYIVSIWFLFLDQLVLCYLFYSSASATQGVIELTRDGHVSLSTVSNSTDLCGNTSRSTIKTDASGRQ